MSRCIEQLTMPQHTDCVKFCPSNGLQDVLAVSTYQLEDDKSRSGQLLFYLLQNVKQSPDVPQSGSQQAQTSVNADAENWVEQKLNKVQQLNLGGIFDIKWNIKYNGSPNGAIIGAACADGSVKAARLEKMDNGTLNSQQFYNGEVCCDSDGMCLALDWMDDSSIVTTTASGSIATLDGSGKVVLQWQGHELEVWTVKCQTSNTNIVYTGADDCCFKGWDTRAQPVAPIFCNRKQHGAGVCCITQSTDTPNSVLTGCYDELIRYWDLRKLNVPIMSCDLNCGGGVWCIEQHPFDSDIILAACMHNGVKILELKGDQFSEVFHYEHQRTLAYGCTWQWKEVGGQRMKHGCTGSSIASCSFYDQQVHVWSHLN